MGFLFVPMSMPLAGRDILIITPCLQCLVQFWKNKKIPTLKIHFASNVYAQLGCCGHT